jgi:hypothetical protein
MYATKNMKNESKPEINKFFTNKSKLYEQSLAAGITWATKLIFQLIKAFILS